MKINTRKFGEVDIDKEKILAMPDGLPGFDGFEKFVLLEDPQTAPFCWFQSIDEPNLSLIIMNPLLFEPDYTLSIEGFLGNQGWKDIAPDEVLVYVVVNISEGKPGKKITANLMGPLLINPKSNEVVQVVLSDTAYSHQHVVFESS